MPELNREKNNAATKAADDAKIPTKPNFKTDLRKKNCCYREKKSRPVKADVLDLNCRHCSTMLQGYSLK